MELRRFFKGFCWGAVAAVLMGVLMFAARATGIAPMPKPISAAIVGDWAVFLSPGVVTALSIVVGLVYCGFWAGWVTLLANRVTLWHGLALGVALWVVLGWIFLSWLGWGDFGLAVDSNILWATLVAHLVYGAAFGLLTDRGTACGGSVVREPAGAAA